MRAESLDGYRQAGADRLIALAAAPSLDGLDRVEAAERLTKVKGRTMRETITTVS